MPESKKRDPHKHPHKDFIPHKKKRGSAKPAAIIFCIVLALLIAWLAIGAASYWLLVGAVLGAGFGYFLGNQMDKALNKG